jgi:hypothetical protein
MRGKQPLLVRMANTKLDGVRATLSWVFDVATLEGDAWAAAVVATALRALGDDSTNTKLTVQKKSSRRKR